MTGPLPLTKSDFLKFRECAKSLWLAKRQPDVIDWPSPSTFDRMLMKDGYAVEAEVKALVSEWTNCDRFTFQKNFTDGECLARSDMVEMKADGAINLYEIKASSSFKDHLDDACFQRIVAKRVGSKVDRSFVVHVNKDYLRQGPLDREALLSFADVTDQVKELEEEVESAVNDALSMLRSDSIDEDGCSCRLIGNRDRHCPSFHYFNSDIAEPSAYLLPNIRENRLRPLNDQGRLSLCDITEQDLTASQIAPWRAITTGEPVVSLEALRNFLNELTWPLYFYDYETMAPAIPPTQGHQPNSKVPTQFSLHVLDEDGGLTHHEFLAKQFGEEAVLAEQLAAAVGDVGNAIVWNQSFEKACNSTLARMVPKHEQFFEGLNARTVDLMVPFKNDFVHPDFNGSTSIKKVLPVLCPDLQYDETAVHDGGGAMAAWAVMASTDDEKVREKLRRDLLDYCCLDSLAMVRIFQWLQSFVASDGEVK